MEHAPEQALRAQLERAREKLEGLVEELRALDAELEALSPEQKQHRLLGEACERLEALRSLGGERLFWDDAAGAVAEDRLRVVRSRVEAFEKRWDEIEGRRQAVFEEVLQQQEGTELLEDDVLALEREAEERDLDWVIEREISEAPGLATVMPWTRGGEEDVRFRKSLATSLLLAVVFALVVPHVDLPLPEPWKPAEPPPERFVRLVPDARLLRRQPKPETPKPVPAEQRLAKETPRKPEAKAAAKQGPGKGPETGPGVGPKGLLAFREKLSGVAAREPAARLGLDARIQSIGDVASGPPSRSMLTTQAKGSSGGIDLASLSRGVGGGGGAIGGVEVARVTSAISGDGGGGGGHGAGGGVAERGGPPLGRTDEEIQIVFDRHKSALYRLYNRELRSDPSLKGQIVLRIRIEPDGRVTLCEVQASDMGAPQLADQVVERVRTFDFGAKEGIAAVTILYPIDFLPAV